MEQIADPEKTTKFVMVTEYYQGGETEKGEKGGPCGLHRRIERSKQNLKWEI